MSREPEQDPLGKAANPEDAAQGEAPEVYPDPRDSAVEEHLDPPHGATRFEAPAGHGTAEGPPYGQQFQERPVLDGSTQSSGAEAATPNPYRGQEDPATMARQPALNTTSTTRWLIASVIAAVILVVTLLLLSPWNPVWCGVGVTFALVGVLAMLVVRATRMPRKPRLRLEAVLMALVWLVPLAIIVTVVITSADEIWRIS